MATGNSTLNVAPRPRPLSTEISPPCSRTIPWTMERPRPVPTPAGLVVKNGSKMRGSSSGAIPGPLSDISMTTRSAEIFLVRKWMIRPGPSSLFQRLLGIEEQIQHHLLQLSRRQPESSARPCSRSALHINVHQPKFVAAKRQGALGDFVEAHRHSLRFGFPGKQQ